MMSSDSRSGGRPRAVAQCLAAAALAGLVATLPAGAQDYPTRSVKIIVPFPAGGTADAMPRLVADFLSRKWGHPVVIDNRTGAAGNIGAETAFKSDPDGYTLLSAPPPPLVINQNLYPKLGFDPLAFEPIIIISRVPNAIVVNPKNIAAKTVAEFIDYAKANPGKITAATQGNGSTSHLTAELFALMAKVKFQNVPYRGSAPVLTDLVGGTVDIMFDNLGVSLPLVESGNLKLIAVASAKRMASLPDVPAIAETLPVSKRWRGMRWRRRQNPEADRRQDQRRHQRGVAPASCWRASSNFPRRRSAVRRRTPQVHARGSRALEQRDQAAGVKLE